MPAPPTSREDARGRIIFALDVPEATRAAAIIEDLGDAIRFFKIGLELWTAGGANVAARLAHQGIEVFLDLKFHDIPATVEGATRNVAELGARFLTLHEPPSSIRGAVRGRGDSSLQLLGVTYLTSLDPAELRLVHGLPEDLALAEATVRKGRRLLEAGCDGLVCSPLEVGSLRAELPDAVLVVPGIRPAGADTHEQRRVATPARAAEEGADYLVVGRPIRDAPSPVSAVEEILDDAWAGFSRRPARLDAAGSGA